MRNKLLLGLLGVGVGGAVWACSVRQPTPHFVENQAAYQQAAQALLASELFRAYRRRPTEQPLLVDRTKARAAPGLAAVASLLAIEPIEVVEVKADSSLLFQFPHYETTLGIVSRRSTIIYLPSEKYWHLPNARMPNTTLAANRVLTDGWFQSDWAMHIAD